MPVEIDADDIELAHELASLAADIALRLVGGVDLGYRLKADGTPVTEADLAVEAALVDLIRTRRPADAILSEEAGSIGKSGSRRWVLDPIDGTTYFAARTDGWGTHIALEIDGDLMLGMITRPLTRTRWWAVRGRGAFRCDDRDRFGTQVRLRLPAPHRLEGAAIGVYALPSSKLPARLAAAGATIRTAGSHIPNFADGRIDAVVADRDCGFWWDHAPAIIITEEAGGAFTDSLGANRPGRDGGIYAAPALVNDIALVLGWQ